MLRTKCRKDRKIMVRLNKYIADSGITSRRKSEELIQNGRISVNGKVVRELSFKVNPEKDEVKFDGDRILPKRHLYFLMNKPKGTITSTSDERNRKTVLDLIKTKEKIFPVGRLDYNTTGVLLLTNDGNFSNLMTHPKNLVPRKYEATLDKDLEQEDIKKLIRGIFIGGIRGKFKELRFPKKNRKKFVEVVTIEGRNHFVKNMFNALGYNVIDLNRSEFGPFSVDIPTGTYRILSSSEISKVTSNYEK
jgi:23S rRNA pseudouridine2605 synthase